MLGPSIESRLSDPRVHAFDPMLYKYLPFLPTFLEGDQDRIKEHLFKEVGDSCDDFHSPALDKSWEQLE